MVDDVILKYFLEGLLYDFVEEDLFENVRQVGKVLIIVFI